MNFVRRARTEFVSFLTQPGKFLLRVAQSALPLKLGRIFILAARMSFQMTPFLENFYSLYKVYNISLATDHGRKIFPHVEYGS